MHKQSLALKFSFVFVVLSIAISLLTAAWQLAQGKSGSPLLVLETGASLLLVLLPALLSKWLRFYLPAFLYFFFLAFIYCAIYLGDAYHFYYIPYWDKFLHLISGALLFGLAWAIQWNDSFLFFTGAVLGWAADHLFKAKSREYKVPTASGIIAGAALTGMAILMFSIYQAAL